MAMGHLYWTDFVEKCKIYHQFICSPKAQMSGSGRYNVHSFLRPIYYLPNNSFFRFFSKSSLSGRGFKITYQESCGGKFTQDGKLLSPYFPHPSGTFECIYLIAQTPLFAFNEIEIDKFDLGEGDDSCTINFLELRDGANETSPLLGRFCGSSPDNISSLISNHSNVWLK